MNFILKEKKDIDRIITRYYGFHSAFIKRLTIHSDDFFRKDDKICTGIIDIDIDFAHKDYGENVPYKQIIYAKFREVQELRINMPVISAYNWDIYQVKIKKRTSDFVMSVIFHVCDEKVGKWTHSRGLLFAFKRAQFSEKFKTNLKKQTKKIV